MAQLRLQVAKYCELQKPVRYEIFTLMKTQVVVLWVVIPHNDVVRSLPNKQKSLEGKNLSTHWVQLLLLSRRFWCRIWFTRLFFLATTCN
jgi:hypothetical protein